MAANSIKDVAIQSAAYVELRRVRHQILRKVLRRSLEAYKKGRISVDYPVKYRNFYRRALRKWFTKWFLQGRKTAKRRLARAVTIQEQFEGSTASAKNARDINAVLTTAVRKRIKRYAEFVRQLVDSTEKRQYIATVTRAQKVLLHAQQQGWARARIAEELAKRFTSYTEYELNRIITTEHTRLLCLGSTEQMEKDPLVVGYYSRVNYTGCPICDAIENEGPWPKDELHEMPPYHPNCECSIEPVFSFDVEAKDL